MEVYSHELGYTTMEYIGLRGWIFTHHACIGKSHIEYRRLETCLRLHLLGKRGSISKQEGMMKSLHSMLEALFKVLKNDNQN